MYWHNTVPLTQSMRKDSTNHTICLTIYFQTSCHIWLTTLSLYQVTFHTSQQKPFL